MTDAHQRPILVWAGVIRRPEEDRRNLVLTLDFALQRKVGTLLDEAGVARVLLYLWRWGRGKSVLCSGRF